MSQKRILAFSGSSSSRSINGKLLHYAASCVRDAAVQAIDLRDYEMPIYSIDIEQNDSLPENALKLRTLFDQADGFLISCPEHNGLPPVIFKNLIDWLSRMDGKVFQQKPVLAMATSPGPRGGQTVLGILESLLPRWGAQPVGFVSVGNFADVFDARAGELTNVDVDDRVRAGLSALVSATQAA